MLADCAGTYTYHLRVELDEGSVQNATCTCPYEISKPLNRALVMMMKNSVSTTMFRLVDEFLEKPPADIDQPIPVEKQVSDDGRPERHGEQLMDGVTGKVRVRFHQEGGKDGQLNSEVG